MLADKIKEAILYSIGKFDMIDANVWRNHHWGQQEVLFLNFCLQQGPLSGEDFYNAVKTRIIEIGEEMQLQASDTKTRKGEWADHVTSTSALGFAIQAGHFKPKQLDAIRFDHDDTAESFMKGRVDTLVADIMIQLTKRTQIFERAETDVDLCCHD